MARRDPHSSPQRRGRRGQDPSIPQAHPASRPRRRPGTGAGLLLLLCLAVLVAGAGAAERSTPDVVIVVDTSRSMAGRGMDPERSSLLVSKLLSDILPGDLAVVRLLDLADDADLLPRRETGQVSACDENPLARCNQVEPTTDWAELAREQRLGTLVRGSIGDPAFKHRLDAHLAQTSANSLFFLAFRAAQGVFEQHASDNRTLIWLSDGRDEDEPLFADAVNDLQNDGARIETIIFGLGDPAIPTRVGLHPVRVTSPGELMAAFAQAFRRIIGAPYRIDALVERQPEFQVQPRVETMWVVVYGDTSLNSVTLTDPDDRAYSANDAADSQPRAGAYRVARIQAPAPGPWRLETNGGGPGRAYAVVQRSSLAPSLRSPQETNADTETTLVAAITPRDEPDTPITDPELLAESRLRVTIGGDTVTLNDHGEGPDAEAGDGLFSGRYRFTTTGAQPVGLRLESPFAEAEGEAIVQVRGSFRVERSPLDADLGHLEIDEHHCVALTPELDHRGRVPIQLDTRGGLPSDHDVFVRLGGERLDPGAGALEWAAGAPLEVCLAVGPRAPSSVSDGGRRLILSPEGGGDPDQRLEIRLYWELTGLGFWQRWGWLILAILAALAAIGIALGFILPKRFPATLSVEIAPEQDDLEDYPPQSIRIFRGVGIGFYRNARAFLQPDYRLSGRARGALLRLRAVGGSRARIDPRGGHPLYREEPNGDWHEVPIGGEPGRPGEVYRVGESGPFLRLSSR